MSDTYNYEVLEPGGHARLVGNVLDRISEASANPASAVGSSRAMLGDPETASWMERTTAADGAALIEAVYGNTVVQDGSLLPVRMEGIETVGFNQWDEEWELGLLNESGNPATNEYYIRSTNFIPVFPSTQYSATKPTAPVLYVCFYDTDKAFISPRAYGGSGSATYAFETPSNARYIKFTTGDTTTPVTAYNHDICINLSDPARNGTYEPYWHSELTIPATDLRSAGSVYDELQNDKRITRVGEVDLGTLTWTYSAKYVRFSATLAQTGGPFTDLNWTCPLYTTSTNAFYDSNRQDMVITVDNSGVSVRNSSYTDAAAFKTAMSGVMLHYALATPTTTPIDPPLPLSYRTGAGGTEHVMLASGTTSAPPVFATRYPLDPADLAASIAPRESATAEANHAVGDLLMLGFTLCKVTTAIARGEAITIGTNVTRTSVAAEIAALS